MKTLRKKCFGSIVCLFFVSLTVMGISATSGWKNSGWSNLDWRGKACNSETTVYDTPQFEYMSATAKIGDISEKKEASDPSPNITLHASRIGALTKTCEYAGHTKQK